MERVAAERWFLQRGLPSVIPRNHRWRRLRSRSAPALAGLATLQLAVIVLSLGSENRQIQIDASASVRNSVVVALLIVTVPAVAVTGWVMSRLKSERRKGHAATAAVVSLFVLGLFDGTRIDIVEDVVSTAFLTGFVLVLTGLGVGSVLAWGVRLTASHLASIATLAARALPVVLLTVLVFFNGSIWAMAATISPARMLLIVGFMALIAVAFLLSGLWERVKPLLAASAADRTDGTDHLDATPFETVPDPDDPAPLSRGERVNVLFVVAASQITQVLAVAVATTLIFLGLALVVLTPQLVDDWTKNNPEAVTFLGLSLPLALVHVLMFLGALTFMYVSARAVGDGEYRAEFLDPLVDDLQTTLVARDRYRDQISAS